jgi:small subunit ribosomal protein S19
VSLFIFAIGGTKTSRSQICALGAFLIKIMSRSLKKGPCVDPKLLKKIEGKSSSEVGVVKTWARGSQISPEMVGFTFGVHNGKDHIEVLATEEMVGHRLGEFSPTRKFNRHGGKIQKEIDQAKKQAEIDSAKAAKASDKK